MSLYNVKRKGSNITYHEQIYTYKNVEKYDEDILDIDKTFLKVPYKNLEILKRINIYSKYDKNEEIYNPIINKRRRIRNKKVCSNNLIHDIKYMDILICGDKNSGKTTFLNCIGCIDNNNLEIKSECYEKDNMYHQSKNNYHNNDNNNEHININMNNNIISYNNFNNNQIDTNNIFNINYNVKKENEQIIWNDNKLELLSYIPIIFSKLINRNYEQFRKSFKKNFLDTDVCEMSIFITRDDLSFINYEFNISNNFCNKYYFNYIKINFCEYGEDFFHKIKSYYKFYYNKKNKDIRHNKIKKKKKKNKIKNVSLLYSPMIVNMIESALFRIREIKYINFFINLKKSFILVKCTTRLYNMIIKKRYIKRRVLIMRYFKNIKRTLNNILFYQRNIHIFNNYIHLKNDNKQLFGNNIKYKQYINNKKKKKNLFVTINEEWLLKTFENINIIKNINNYNMKDILFLASRSFNFEKLSKKYYIFFNLTYNMNIINNITNKTKKFKLQILYYIINRFVHKNWKVYKYKQRKNKTTNMFTEIIFKYYPNEKKNKYKASHKKKFIYNIYNIYNASHKNNIYISTKKEDMINFLKYDKFQIHNFFKIFYDEYIYKNQNKTYVKLLEDEHFDLCFLFMKLYFYYHFYINKEKEEKRNLHRKKEPKLNFQNFIYLKQIDIIRKNDGIIYNNICVPSCVYSFINLLKMYYKNYPFFTLKKNSILFLVNIILSSIAYYKLKKKSCDFFISSNKWTANYVCYFDKAVIINSIVNLLGKKNEHDEKEVNNNIMKQQEYINKYLFIDTKKKKKLHYILSCLYYKKYKRRRNILQGIIKNVDINNIPPYIIINNIKTHWLYIKKYMINLNICSYHNQYMYKYPDISYDIILYFNDNNKKNFSFNINEQNNYPKISFKPIYKNTYTHIKKNDEDKRRKKKSILHFPFNHKVLKYFSDTFQNINDNKEHESLLQYLYGSFSNLLANLLTYINKEKYKNKHKRINLLVRNNIFLLLNYVMDIYYIIQYTFRGRRNKKKVKLKDKKLYITINNSNDTYINETNIPNNSLLLKEEKKITFHIYKNDPLFNSIYFLWEDLKINETQKKLIQTYLEHLREHFYFSIYA
ncbi:conserved Plasmodium protein, unknown function [Plasmodium sp. gorilla clade G2]|uniref:conserved Plasmodium protein, unknown function n=1 Tax=Plasmodium sp. gorilla clade G2 TaxID=880535 RepID=UPI000D229493|nr:conserved Plasmodium protein, unknown function [Plasmodium sp. gorilla clade G2]SOV18449.1 conserved Plasmodium protein, unknown function [Plasmodium sp. gorilla clade G2]